MSSITEKISHAASSVTEAMSNAATYVHDAIVTPAAPKREYTSPVVLVNTVHKAADDAEDKVKCATRTAIAEIDGAAGIAHAAIKVSSGDSAVNGAQDIYKNSVKDAEKKFECKVKEAKEEFGRVTSSATSTCTADEKTSVSEAVKVGEAKFEGAVKVAKAEVEQAQKKTQESIKCTSNSTVVSEKAYEAAQLGHKTAQTRFEQVATEALDMVKAATKNVRDAKTPGEQVDNRLIVKNELVKAHQKLDQANLDAQRNREDVTAAGRKAANEFNCAASHAKIETSDKEALAKQQASYKEFQAKLEAEAKTVAA